MRLSALTGSQVADFLISMEASVAAMLRVTKFSTNGSNKHPFRDKRLLFYESTPEGDGPDSLQQLNTQCLLQQNVCVCVCVTDLG